MKKVLMAVSLLTIVACKKSSTTTTSPGGGNTAIDSLSYYDINTGNWYYHINPFISCDISQYSYGYDFSLHSSGIDNDKPAPFSIWILSDIGENKNNAVGNYHIHKSTQYVVEENFTQDKYGKVTEYTVENGTVKITEATSLVIRGEYTLNIKNTANNTYKDIAGKFVNYNPE